MVSGHNIVISVMRHTTEEALLLSPQSRCAFTATIKLQLWH